MLIELPQLFPDSLLLPSYKTVLSSPKTPSVSQWSITFYRTCTCVTLSLNHGQITLVQKGLIETVIIKHCSERKLLTSITRDVAVRASCMLGMLPRRQNLHICVLFWWEEHSVFISFFYIRNKTNLSTLLTLKTIRMPIKAEGLEHGWLVLQYINETLKRCCNQGVSIGTYDDWTTII